MKLEHLELEQQLKLAIINSVCSELIECPDRIVKDCKSQIEGEYIEYLKKTKKKESDEKSVESSE